MKKILIGLDGSVTESEMTDEESKSLRGPQKSYKELRKDAYNRYGATIENLVIAMFEKDAAEIERLQNIRQQVKQEVRK